MSEEKEDAYYRSLPEIVRKLREKNQYALTTKEAFWLALLLLFPIIGCIYYIKKRSDKNLNIRNFAKVAIPINLIHTVIVCGVIVGIAFLMPLSGNTNQQATTKAETDFEQTEEPLPESEEEKKEQTSVDKEEQSSSDKKAVMVKDNQLYVSLNYEMIAFPFTVSDVTSLGFQMSDQIPNPEDESQALAYYYDAAGSSLVLTLNSDGTCVAVDFGFIDASSELCGLTMQSTLEEVSQIFTSADSSDDSSFDAQSGYGSISYAYGNYQIDVTLENNYVTLIHIQK